MKKAKEWIDNFFKEATDFDFTYCYDSTRKCVRWYLSSSQGYISSTNLKNENLTADEIDECLDYISTKIK